MGPHNRGPLGPEKLDKRPPLGYDEGVGTIAGDLDPQDARGEEALVHKPNPRVLEMRYQVDTLGPKRA